MNHTPGTYHIQHLFVKENPFIWVFPKIGGPQNGWFILENPIKMDDLGVPLFSETSIFMFWAHLLVNLALSL